jgi:23S rRNA pseudoU1915 N3-methylase RlmH
MLNNPTQVEEQTEEQTESPTGFRLASEQSSLAPSARSQAEQTEQTATASTLETKIRNCFQIVGHKRVLSLTAAIPDSDTIFYVYAFERLESIFILVCSRTEKLTEKSKINLYQHTLDRNILKYNGHFTGQYIFKVTKTQGKFPSIKILEKKEQDKETKDKEQTKETKEINFTILREDVTIPITAVQTSKNSKSLLYNLAKYLCVSDISEVNYCVGGTNGHNLEELNNMFSDNIILNYYLPDRAYTNPIIKQYIDTQKIKTKKTKENNEQQNNEGENNERSSQF